MLRNLNLKLHILAVILTTAALSCLTYVFISDYYSNRVVVSDNVMDKLTNEVIVVDSIYGNYDVGDGAVIWSDVDLGLNRYPLNSNDYKKISDNLLKSGYIVLEYNHIGGMVEIKVLKRGTDRIVWLYGVSY